MSAEIIRSKTKLPDDVKNLVAIGKQYHSLGIGAWAIRRSPDKLSFGSRLVLDAAGILWGPGRSVLLSGSDKSMYPDAGSNYLWTNFTVIPTLTEDEIDRSSLTTRDHAKHIGEMLSKKEGLSALITIGDHVERADREVNGIKPIVDFIVVAEDIVAEASPERRNEIEQWLSSPLVRMDRALEGLANNHPAIEEVGGLVVRGIRLLVPAQR